MARKTAQDYIREALAASQMVADDVPEPSARVPSVLSAGPAHPRYPRGSVSSGGGMGGGMGGNAGGGAVGGIGEAALANSIQKLLAASGGRVKIVSGKRSSQRQAQLWAGALKKYGSAAAARKWVAPPGRSRHERGEAYDLGGDLNLAARLAGQFGLYKPMSHEPWHFENKGSRR